MRRLLLPLVIVFGFAGISCDEEDDNMDTGNDTNGEDGMDDGADDGADGVMTSSSMEECVSMHECINDVCTCQTPGMEDEPCTDEEMCVDECEVCM